MQPEAEDTIHTISAHGLSSVFASISLDRLSPVQEVTSTLAMKVNVLICIALSVLEMNRGTAIAHKSIYFLKQSHNKHFNKKHV